MNNWISRSRENALFGWSDEVLATACMKDEALRNTGSPIRDLTRRHQGIVRELEGVAESTKALLLRPDFTYPRNAAVLVDPQGKLLLHRRKVNELDIALDLYSIGDRLGVASTELGTLGINICADNFANSLAIAHVLARMGAQVILSPSAWAVDADHDNHKELYGGLWIESYRELARLYDLTVIGVSNVGWLDAGPWKGRKVIGCSLAVDPGGEILTQGPYGHDAEALIPVCVSPLRREVQGTLIADDLKRRGYRGP